MLFLIKAGLPKQPLRIRFQFRYNILFFGYQSKIFFENEIFSFSRDLDVISGTFSVGPRTEYVSGSVYAIIFLRHERQQNDGDVGCHDMNRCAVVFWFFRKNSQVWVKDRCGCEGSFATCSLRNRKRSPARWRYQPSGSSRGSDQQSHASPVFAMLVCQEKPSISCRKNHQFHVEKIINSMSKKSSIPCRKNHQFHVKKIIDSMYAFRNFRFWEPFFGSFFFSEKSRFSKSLYYSRYFAGPCKNVEKKRPQKRTPKTKIPKSIHEIDDFLDMESGIS